MTRLLAIPCLAVLLVSSACTNDLVSPKFHAGPGIVTGAEAGSNSGGSTASASVSIPSFVSPTGVPGTPGVCAVPAWGDSPTSCSGTVIASGSMNWSDLPSDAAYHCEHAGVVGSCCMFHLISEGVWYLTDGLPQSQATVCDPATQDECRSGGVCTGGGPANSSFQITGSTNHVTLTPALPQIFPEFTTLKFTVTPDAGYEVIATVEGSCPRGTWDGATYTMSQVPGSCTVSFSAVPQGSPGTCSVGAWNSPTMSCSGTVLATGSLNDSDSSADAAAACEKAKVAGTCCMYHLYGAGAWYLTDGQPQAGARNCDPSVSSYYCRAAGSCQ